MHSNNPLHSLLSAASKDDLIELLTDLAGNNSSIQRRCINTLKEKALVSQPVYEAADSAAALALWSEIEPDLSELDEYGGGDYNLMDDVGDGLYQLEKTLQEITLQEEDRDELLDEVIAYIQSGNAGMDDSLYDIAYATCKNNDDLAELAQRFERLNQDWPTDHARRIYRKIGDHKKYLELRYKSMKYGADYHDLATYYWESGEKKKAIDIAKQGMQNAEGRMDELRLFLGDRAKESGDREGYLDYCFAQKTDRLTLASYKEFKAECHPNEWEKYEPRIVNLLESNFNIQAVKIYLHREEFEKALRYFTAPRRTIYYSFGDSDIFSVAQELENRYPEQILQFYKSAIGNLNTSTTRKVYAQNAEAVMRVRRVLVDVMNSRDEWKIYAQTIKSDNAKRPAFQEEFARVIPDWKSL